MRKHRSAALVCGGAATGVLGAVLFGSSPEQPAWAQPAPAGSIGRYQISTYGYDLGTGGSGSQAERGAYILDTQTGEVFVIVNTNAPRIVGSVSQAKK